MNAASYPPLWKGPDHPGSRMPRKFTAMTWMQHPTLRKVFAEFNVEVPGDFWSEDVEAEQTVAIISCPCGQEPEVMLHSTEFCTGCNRVFFFLGDKVLVAKDPSQPDPEPEEEESSADGRRLEADGGDSSTGG